MHNLVDPAGRCRRGTAAAVRRTEPSARMLTGTLASRRETRASPSSYGLLRRRFSCERAASPLRVVAWRLRGALAASACFAQRRLLAAGLPLRSWRPSLGCAARPLAASAPACSSAACLVGVDMPASPSSTCGVPSPGRRRLRRLPTAAECRLPGPSGRHLGCPGSSPGAGTRASSSRRGASPSRPACITLPWNRRITPWRSRSIRNSPSRWQARSRSTRLVKPNFRSSNDESTLRMNCLAWRTYIGQRGGFCADWNRRRTSRTASAARGSPPAPARPPPRPPPRGAARSDSARRGCGSARGAAAPRGRRARHCGGGAVLGRRRSPPQAPRGRCAHLAHASRGRRPRASARSRGSCSRRRSAQRTSSRAAAACS